MQSGRSAGERVDAAMAELERLVNWERRDRTADMGRTLEPVRDLLERLGSPERAWRAVHVAGTKGKGSVSALVAAALAEAGLLTGLYSSPHVERVNERVRIGGREVGDELLAEALERALQARARAIEAGSPASSSTWFDLVTAAAFWVFAERGVEWAAVECGLGGRLDSTNVVQSEVCVVTNVDLEHTAVLGRTRARIAAEKGAILRPGGVLVTGVRERPELGPEEDALGVLRALARERGGRLREVDAGGDLESRNRALAEAVLEELGSLLVRGPRGAVGAGLLSARAIAAARLPARMEVLSARGIPVLLDGAHVASSVEDLLAEAPRRLGRPPPYPLVLALGREKELALVLKALLGHVDTVHCTSCPAGPLRSAGELAEAARALGLRASAHPTPAQALDAALDRASASGRGGVVALGSFYLAGELRPRLSPPVAEGTPADPC